MTTTSRLLLSFAVFGWFQGITGAQTTRVANLGTPEHSSMASSYSSVDAQLADALRQLMRIRLERAIQFNSRVPGTYSANYVDTMKGKLAAIDQQQGRNGEAVDWFSAMLSLAEVSKNVANADWQRVSAHRKDPQSFLADFDFETARVRAQLAELNLQRGRLAAKGTAEDRQNWAILFVMMEIQQLKDQTR